MDQDREVSRNENNRKEAMTILLKFIFGRGKSNSVLKQLNKLCSQFTISTIQPEKEMANDLHRFKHL
jgi:hypothetical protein